MDDEEFKFFLRGYSCNERRKKKLFRVFQHRKKMWNDICQRKAMFIAMEDLSMQNLMQFMSQNQQEPSGFILDRECCEDDYFKSTPLFWHEYSRYLNFNFTPIDAYEQEIVDEVDELVVAEPKPDVYDVTSEYEPPVDFQYSFTSIGKYLFKNVNVQHNQVDATIIIPLGWYETKTEDLNINDESRVIELNINIDNNDDHKFDSPSASDEATRMSLDFDEDIVSYSSPSSENRSPQCLPECYDFIFIANKMRTKEYSEAVSSFALFSKFPKLFSCSVLTELWDVLLASLKHREAVAACRQLAYFNDRIYFFSFVPEFLNAVI